MDNSLLFYPIVIFLIGPYTCLNFVDSSQQRHDLNYNQESDQEGESFKLEFNNSQQQFKTAGSEYASVVSETTSCNLLSGCGKRTNFDDDTTKSVCSGHINKGNRFYNNIVLEGGGFRILSYVGALKAFGDQGYYANDKYVFENIAGTSAGCVMGFIIALDIHPDQLIDIFDESQKYIPTFMSDIYNLYEQYKLSQTSNLFNALHNTYKIVTTIMDMIDRWSQDENPGLIDHNYLIRWLENEVIPHSRYADSINNATTLADLLNLTKHNLTCIATSLNTRQMIVYNAYNSPKKNLFEVIYSSSTIPLLMKPLQFGSSDRKAPIVDGAFFNNFPISLFDDEIHRCTTTVALSLRSSPKNNKLFNKQLNEEYYDRNNLDEWLGNDFVKANTKQNEKNVIKIVDGNVMESNNLQTTANNNGTFKYCKTSLLDYLAMIYWAVIDKEYVQYSSDPNNAKRIVYLDSPINIFGMFQTDLLKAKAISRAYIHTMTFLNKMPKAKSSN